MDASAIDTVRLNFNPTSLMFLNLVIGLMMFGMALDIRFKDFKRIFISPRGPLIGLVTQFVLLPAGTFLLTLVIKPHPSMALGMILVAACPGGNLSNVITYLARGNAALSISMTAASTAAAIFMTPLNVALWGSLNPTTDPLLRQVALRPWDVFSTIVLILGLPLALGLTISHMFPNLVNRVRKPFKVGSVVIFCGFVATALAVNGRIFIQVIGLVMLVVLLHNGMALFLGWAAGRITKLPDRDVRAVTIEVGIQNSALGLVLIFNFFDGLGGMAIIAGWWGVWHIIAGLGVAMLWSRHRPADMEARVS